MKTSEDVNSVYIDLYETSYSWFKKNSSYGMKIFAVVNDDEADGKGKYLKADFMDFDNKSTDKADDKNNEAYNNSMKKTNFKVNQEKAEDYKKLVRDVQKKYPVYDAKVADKISIDISQKINKIGDPDAREVVKNFADTFINKNDFYKTLKEMGLKWMEVNNARIYEMRAKEALRIAIENGFDPFNVVTKKDAPVELFAPVVNGENICHEINLYTYWQGLGYAEKTPKIKYLLVAQDWGNCFNDTEFIERIKKINNNENISYLDKDKKICPTDKNLMELFKILGYDDIFTRHDELFFTNFCLGYRSGKDVGGMTKELMMKDIAEFKRLCEILEPENILCLGKLTAECVYKALKDSKLEETYGDAKSYNEFLDNNPIAVLCYGKDNKFLSNVYPLAHCGYMGTMNRPLEKQMQDWKSIVDEKKIDIAIEKFSRTNTEEDKNRVLNEIFSRVQKNESFIIALQNFGNGNFLDDVIPIFKNIKSVFLRNKHDGKYFLAAFTNLFEFAKFNESSERKFDFMYVPAKKLLHDCLNSDDDSEGIILNPAAENQFRLTQNMIKEFWNR